MLFKDKANLTEKNLSKVLDKILRALTYIHGEGIAHRDIKVENVIVALDKKKVNFEDLILKIIDFGLSA